MIWDQDGTGQALFTPKTGKSRVTSGRIQNLYTRIPKGKSRYGVYLNPGSSTPSMCNPLGRSAIAHHFITPYYYRAVGNEDVLTSWPSSAYQRLDSRSLTRRHSGPMWQSKQIPSSSQISAQSTSAGTSVQGPNKRRSIPAAIPVYASNHPSVSEKTKIRSYEGMFNQYEGPIPG
jgi:hypothetical protein